MKLHTLSAFTLSVPVLARSIPSNVQSFYDQVKGANRCDGNIDLQGGLQTTDGANDHIHYCSNNKGHVLFLSGRSGELADMDIDCDGDSSGGDGRCSSTGDTQPDTAFQDQVSSYGIDNLNANIHPYVVFGNEKGVEFYPQDHRVQPLSVMAVVCGDQLLYGIWGDTNGDESHVVGEASLSLATACFGDSMNNDNGHDEKDVLYLAFTGDQAVPGKDGANWQASNFDEFESSIENLGNELIKRI